MEDETQVTELENQVQETTTETEAMAEQETEVTNSIEEAEVVETTTENQETETSEEENLSVEQAILEKFGNIGETVEEIVQLAKEGYENRKSVIQKAFDSGVHFMGNAFNKDVFAKTFSNMNTADIEEMGKTWEQQAKNLFEKQKISKQDTNKKKEEEFKRIGLSQFKTDNY